MLVKDGAPVEKRVRLFSMRRELLIKLSISLLMIREIDDMRGRKTTIDERDKYQQVILLKQVEKYPIKKHGAAK